MKEDTAIVYSGDCIRRYLVHSLSDLAFRGAGIV